MAEGHKARQGDLATLNRLVSERKKPRRPLNSEYLMGEREREEQWPDLRDLH